MWYMFLGYKRFTNISCLFLGERPKSAGTHRAIEDKVFSLVTASMQSDDEDSGKYHYALMDSSFWFDAINMGVSIVYIEESQVIISKQELYFFLRRSFLS